MLNDHFQLDSGRRVRIQRIWVDKTFGGILVGHPDYVSQFLRERTPGELKQKHGLDVLVLFPREHLLPPYRFTVCLESDPMPDRMESRLDCIRKDLPLGHHWDLSFMYVCWYQKSLDGNLVDFVKAATRAVEWEKHAKNTSCD